MEKIIEGRVWKFAANVDTDQIIPAKYLVTGDAQELAQHAFENLRPDFAEYAEPGDIIVAEENFGCGSSREHAPRALLGAGISCVVAKSFARIFYRNAINIGLPVIQSNIKAVENDLIRIEFDNGLAINVTSGREYKFKPLPEFVLKLLEDGGLIRYVKEQLHAGKA